MIVMMIACYDFSDDYYYYWLFLFFLLLLLILLLLLRFFVFGFAGFFCVCFGEKLKTFLSIYRL